MAECLLAQTDLRRFAAFFRATGSAYLPKNDAAQELDARGQHSNRAGLEGAAQGSSAGHMGLTVVDSEMEYVMNMGHARDFGVIPLASGKPLIDSVIEGHAAPIPESIRPHTPIAAEFVRRLW